MTVDKKEESPDKSWRPKGSVLTTDSNEKDVVTSDNSVSEGSIEDTSKKDTKNDKKESKGIKNHIHGNEDMGIWITMSIITVVSFFMRIFKIGYSDDGLPVFDEKHYAIQAKEVLLNHGIENNPGYGLVVHPPMAKWFIAFGEMIFGYNPLGWRFTAICAGVAVVFLICLMVYRFTKSIPLVVMAGVAANTEGVLFAMSRIGMLDIFLTLAIVTIAFCVVMDVTSDTSKTPWHQRWWLFSAGVVSGIAMSIKVSGVLYPALVGICVVIGTALTSRNVRETLKSFGMGLVFFFVIPTTIFLLSYAPWFASESSSYRNVIKSGIDKYEVPDWLQWLPDSIKGFIYYQWGVLDFHTGLHSSADKFHPYESKPWEWLIGVRPMLFYSDDGRSSIFTDGNNSEVKLWLMGNITLWWFIIPIMLYCLYRVVFSRDFKWFVVLCGFTLGWLPWAVNPDRQMYFFYTAAFIPFIVMGVSFIIHDISSKIASRKKNKSPEDEGNKKMSTKTRVEIVIVSIYSLAMISFFAVYITIYYGIPMPESWSDNLMFLEVWNPVKDDNVSQVISFRGFLSRINPFS